MNAPPVPRLHRVTVLPSLAARPRLCKYRSEHAGQEFQGVAAEDLVDAGRRETAGSQQAGQVVELIVTGQDRTVVPSRSVPRATRSGPAASASRMISVPKSARDRLVIPQGQAPTRPPASAT